MTRCTFNSFKENVKEHMGISCPTKPTQELIKDSKITDFIKTEVLEEMGVDLTKIDSLEFKIGFSYEDQFSQNEITIGRTVNWCGNGEISKLKISHHKHSSTGFNNIEAESKEKVKQYFDLVGVTK